MLPGVGLPEIIIVLVVVLVIFGPKRLPDLGRSLGSGMKEFKESVTGDKKDESDTKLASGDKPEPARTPAEKSETPAAGGQGS